MIKTYNIKDRKPSVEIAIKMFDNCLKEARYQKFKVIKIIHGYGSTGIGGVIKVSLHSYLQKLKREQRIKAYIPGEAYSEILGFDFDINKYKVLIGNDNDAKIGNPGITYVLL